MKKVFLFIMVLIVSVISFSCSKDDNNSNSSNNNLRNVEVVLTKGKASRMEVVPSDKNLENEKKDELLFENVSKASFKLPDYTEHFYLKIQGNQKLIEGYVKINGKERFIQAIDWYYNGTFYLYDFK